MAVSLNFRLESNKEEEEAHGILTGAGLREEVKGWASVTLTPDKFQKVNFPTKPST